MTGAITLLALAAALALAILALVLDWARRRYMAWREARDMRIRNERLAKHNIVAFRGTKDRWLS